MSLNKNKKNKDNFQIPELCLISGMKEKEETQKNYEHSRNFSLTSQMKSFMAINPSFGCIWDCIYCIQHKDEFFDKGNYTKINQVKENGEELVAEDIVSEIMVNPRITSKTPLTFYNFSDAFLPHNTSKLEKTLKEMDERQFTNIVGLITRTLAPKKFLDTLSSLEHIRPVVLVSYAGYKDKNIESAPNGKRVQLIRELNKRNIPVLQYLRPVVSEWLDDDQFKRTRDLVGEHINGVVMSGLRLTPEIVDKIERRGGKVPYTKNYTNKYFPKELQKKIVDTYEGVAPVFRYTSCGVSSIFELPDYNAHFDFVNLARGDDSAECNLPCTDEQRKICGNHAINYIPSREKVLKLARKIGQEDRNFTIDTRGRVYFEEPLTKYDLTFYRHNLSKHVDYYKNKHTLDPVHEPNIK